MTFVTGWIFSMWATNTKVKVNLSLKTQMLALQFSNEYLLSPKIHNKKNHYLYYSHRLDSSFFSSPTYPSFLSSRTKKSSSFAFLNISENLSSSSIVWYCWSCLGPNDQSFSSSYFARHSGRNKCTTMES